MELDTIDHKIIASLLVDARISNASLAERVGLSPSACLRRVNALETGGVISGYRALVDPTVLGIELTVLVHIGLQRRGLGLVRSRREEKSQYSGLRHDFRQRRLHFACRLGGYFRL